MKNENVEIVRAAFLGRLNQSQDIIADEFVAHLAEGLPFGREYHGWQGYNELMGELQKFYSELQPESLAFIPYGDDKVIMHFTIDARIAKNGQHFRMPIMTIWRLNTDKKAVEITIFYFDTKRVADLAAK
jgi:hypothetical protein